VVRVRVCRECVQLLPSNKRVEATFEITGLVSDISSLVSVCVRARVRATSTFKRRFNMAAIC
jgi:hypothetical protein